MIAPEIDIQKTPDTQTVVTGSDVTFTITVTNTVMPISPTWLSPMPWHLHAMPPSPRCRWAPSRHDFTVTGVTADFTNVADVIADEPAGGTVTDSDDAIVDVIDPAITIAKTPDTRTVLTGDDVTFTITVPTPATLT